MGINFRVFKIREDFYSRVFFFTIVKTRKQNLLPIKYTVFTFSVAFFRYAPKFDEHARQLLSSGPYPVFVPPDGSVYDYSLDFIKGALVKWDERPGAQFKTLPSSYTVVSEVKYKKPS